MKTHVMYKAYRVDGLRFRCFFKLVARMNGMLAPQGLYVQDEFGTLVKVSLSQSAVYFRE